MGDKEDLVDLFGSPPRTAIYVTFSTQKFCKFAETLQQLGSYDQIPRLLAYFEENQEFYLVQEFINGHLLSKELLPGTKWTESQIIEMLVEVLGILEYEL